MSESNYKFYKARGICPYCKKGKPAPGKSLCEECAEKQRTYFANLPPERAEQFRARKRENSKQKYSQRKAAGLCVDCGKPVYKDGVRCYEHYLRNRRLGRERTERKKLEKPAGSCRNCNAPALPGKKLCQYHYDLACAAMAKARAVEKKKRDKEKETHPWERGNKMIFGGYGNDER
nr:MAG TPA: NinG protein [Caudoviricetes sp.]